MPDEILESVAQDMRSINERLSRARDLAEAMREAGEDVTTLESQIHQLEVRKQRWELMLKNRGYLTGGESE